MSEGFHKYSASGNDFIIINAMGRELDIEPEDAIGLCHRRFGVGADGIIVVEDSETADFKMRIHNSDGSIAEMCGNGARSCIHYAHNVLELHKSPDYTIETMNGLYSGSVLDELNVSVKMTELYDVEKIDLSFLGVEKTFYCNTGVPHSVIEVADINEHNSYLDGKAISKMNEFEHGTNVNFYSMENVEQQTVAVDTFERGVNDITFCCGTGCVATAIALNKFYGWTGDIKLISHGGETVTVNIDEDLSNIYYQGTVYPVFFGEIF